MHCAYFEMFLYYVSEHVKDVVEETFGEFHSDDKFEPSPKEPLADHLPILKPQDLSNQPIQKTYADYEIPQPTLASTKKPTSVFKNLDEHQESKKIPPPKFGPGHYPTKTHVGPLAPTKKQISDQIKPQLEKDLLTKPDFTPDKKLPDVQVQHIPIPNQHLHQDQVIVSPHMPPAHSVNKPIAQEPSKKVPVSSRENLKKDIPTKPIAKVGPLVLAPNPLLTPDLTKPAAALEIEKEILMPGLPLVPHHPMTLTGTEQETVHHNDHQYVYEYIEEPEPESSYYDAELPTPLLAAPANNEELLHPSPTIEAEPILTPTKPGELPKVHAQVNEEYINSHEIERIMSEEQKLSGQPQMSHIPLIPQPPLPEQVPIVSGVLPALPSTVPFHPEVPPRGPIQNKPDISYSNTYPHDPDVQHFKTNSHAIKKINPWRSLEGPASSYKPVWSLTVEEPLTLAINDYGPVSHGSMQLPLSQGFNLPTIQRINPTLFQSPIYSKTPLIGYQPKAYRAFLPALTNTRGVMPNQYKQKQGWNAQGNWKWAKAYRQRPAASDNADWHSPVKRQVWLPNPRESIPQPHQNLHQDVLPGNHLVGPLPLSSSKHLKMMEDSKIWQGSRVVAEGTANDDDSEKLCDTVKDALNRMGSKGFKWALEVAKDAVTDDTKNGHRNRVGTVPATESKSPSLAKSNEDTVADEIFPRRLLAEKGMRILLKRKLLQLMMDRLKRRRLLGQGAESQKESVPQKVVASSNRLLKTSPGLSAKDNKMIKVSSDGPTIILPLSKKVIEQLTDLTASGKVNSKPLVHENFGKGYKVSVQQPQELAPPAAGKMAHLAHMPHKQSIKILPPKQHIQPQPQPMIQPSLVKPPSAWSGSPPPTSNWAWQKPPQPSQAYRTLKSPKSPSPPVLVLLKTNKKVPPKTTTEPPSKVLTKIVKRTKVVTKYRGPKGKKRKGRRSNGQTTVKPVKDDSEDYYYYPDEYYSEEEEGYPDYDLHGRSDKNGADSGSGDDEADVKESPSSGSSDGENRVLLNNRMGKFGISSNTTGERELETYPYIFGSHNNVLLICYFCFL